LEVGQEAMFVTKLDPEWYSSNPWDWSLDDRLKRLSRRPDRRIAYFYETPDNSTFRYRVYNMIQALEASPSGSTASFFCSADLNRMQSIVETTDILVVCRARYTPEIDRLICSVQSKGKKVFFDVDDLVFDPSYVNLLLNSLDQDTSKPEIWDHWFALVGRIGATMRLCDAVIATNDYLAEKTREFSGKESRVIPNFLNREQIHISDRIFQTKSVNRFGRSGTLSIGYFSGSPTHNKDFRIVTSALREILDTYGNVSLRVVGYLDLKDELLGHRSRIEFVPFQDFINLQTVIGSTEINIAPLQDNAFTNCKSELKYFEAAVVGTVTIASPTYTFANAINHGTNGFLANSYEWFDKLQEVIESYDQLESLVQRARDDAREKYGWFGRWNRIEEVLFESQKSAPALQQSDCFCLPVSAEKISVGIVGTFDVENYGDLLFPLMAAAAFERREKTIRVVPFSPNDRSEQEWPFQVNSTENLPESLPALSAVLIGGGQLLRFDKAYPIPSDPNVNLPVAYWLIPAVLGALIGKPIVWNAIGAWTNSPSAPWYDDVVKRVLSVSHFVGVRDTASREHLKKLAPGVEIQVLPDTAFSLSRFWPLERESQEYMRWRQGLGLGNRYIVIQANHFIANYRAAIEVVMRKMEDCTAVILPVCWCHGDRATGFPPLPGKVIGSPEWLAPRLIAEIIGRSELIVASSLHACITALSYGVPVARVPASNAADRKFELLDEFEGVELIDNLESLGALIARGQKIESRVLECADRLDRYWDWVTELALTPHTRDPKRSMALMLGWASNVFADIETSALARSSLPSHAQRIDSSQSIPVG
jgi:glycosyltransferase involved in cell wall biosynthesis